MEARKKNYLLEILSEALDCLAAGYFVCRVVNLSIIFMSCLCYSAERKRKARRGRSGNLYNTSANAVRRGRPPNYPQSLMDYAELKLFGTSLEMTDEKK